MKKFKRVMFGLDDFRFLATQKGKTCISLYIPTHRSGMEVNENLDCIAFKDSVKKAEILLKDLGKDQHSVDAILKPAKNLVADHLFWKDQLDGLVVFLAEDLFEFFKVPISLESFEYVGNEFYLTPLIPLVTDKSDFFLLALSINSVKLYKANHFEIEELDLEGLLPQGVKEIKLYDVYQKENQIKTGGNTGTGAVVFSNDNANRKRKEEVRRYVQAIEEGLKKLIGVSKAPVLVAAVDFVFGFYRKFSTLPNLMEQGLIGNPEHKSLEQLHDEAWTILHPYFDQVRLKAAEIYENLSASGKTCTEIDEIVSGSVFSRVDKLFLENGKHVWGYFDSKNNRIVLHKNYVTGDQDLANTAAVSTLLNGGDVFLLDRFRMPNFSDDVAAVFRYEDRAQS